MSANGTGRSCRTRAHWGKSLEIYDTLPRAIRDRLKIAKGNVCAGCVSARSCGAKAWTRRFPASTPSVVPSGRSTVAKSGGAWSRT